MVCLANPKSRGRTKQRATSGTERDVADFLKPSRFLTPERSAPNERERYDPPRLDEEDTIPSPGEVMTEEEMGGDAYGPLHLANHYYNDLLESPERTYSDSRGEEAAALRL